MVDLRVVGFARDFALEKYPVCIQKSNWLEFCMEFMIARQRIFFRAGLAIPMSKELPPEQAGAG
jgi:hypothetical protein